jgi:type VI secretion system protein VasG
MSDRNACSYAEHWLLLLEQGEGDLTVLPAAMNGMDAVWQSLLSWLDAQPRSFAHATELSALQTLKKQALPPRSRR